MDFEHYYNRLNSEQKKAADIIDGPVLVLAGPGTGKTELLAVRIANILKNTDVLPSSILCLTFTDAAALNMRKRLLKIIGQTAYEVAIHTFHSFGTEIIGRYSHFFYSGAIYQPADELVQIQILEEIFKELEHDNPFGAYHSSQGYTYLKESLKRISELKKGGLTPGEYKNILEANKIFIQEANRILNKFYTEGSIRGKKDIPLIRSLIDDLSETRAYSKKLPGNVEVLNSVILQSIKDAYLAAESEESTKPLTKWKNKYLKKNKYKEFVLKDFDQMEKNFALAEIYEKYQELLHKKGFYDYDDMLLEVLKAIKEYPELLNNLQEKYLYYLIDEFQDTSGVQMRLIDLLLESVVSEGRPNIFAVGDDDQAIFKFQGANLDNIINFYEKYKSPEIVLLNQNYRSTSEIIEKSQSIIKKGRQRLENKIENLNKNLVSAGTNTEQSNIRIMEFNSEIREYIWVSSKIRELNKKNDIKHGEIAVIARKHSQLEYIARVLDYYKIPINYERRKNIFDLLHIRQIIQILKFISTLSAKKTDEADELLPEILSYSFWNVSKLEIWKISTNAYREKKNWLEAMLEHPNDNIRNIAKFLITVSVFSHEHTAEEVIDVVLGNREINISDTIEEHIYKCPYKNHYFSEEILNNKTQSYLELLAALNVFIKNLRKFNGSFSLTVKEAIEFVDLHIKNNIPLNVTNSFNEDEDAVNLLTVHKAKGQEFKKVFIIGCLNEVWCSRKNFDKVGFPSNLPLKADPDDEDDMLRIFFVAYTRAKTDLYLTYYKYNENGKESLKLKYIEEEAETETVKSDENEAWETEKLIELNVLEKETGQISDDEKKLIKTLLRDYKMSVTHLINYLDIVYCGPQKFLERSILRFPQMQTVGNAYGSAMHKAIEQFYKDYKKKRSLPELDSLLNYYVSALSAQRLNSGDFKRQLQKGQQQLKTYYQNNKNEFSPNDEIEVNFRMQGCSLGEAAITGKIDKIRKENNKIIVYDYKTGKALGGNTALTDSDKIKLWKYTTQLTFYKLLIESARDFKTGFNVEKGFLEFLDASEKDDKQLEHTILNIETERLTKLISIVNKKIQNLEFPDTSNYKKSMKGIEEFIEDILSGKI